MLLIYCHTIVAVFIVLNFLTLLLHIYFFNSIIFLGTDIAGGGWMRIEKNKKYTSIFDTSLAKAKRYFLIFINYWLWC